MLPRHRDEKPAMVYDLFIVVSQNRCSTIPAMMLIDPIKVDKMNPQFRFVDIGNTVFESSTHKDQVRVGIKGFSFFFALTQLSPQIHTIVEISFIWREQCLIDPDELIESPLAIVEFGTEPLLEISGRSMEGAASNLPVVLQQITVLITDSRGNINDIES